MFLIISAAVNISTDTKDTYLYNKGVLQKDFVKLYDGSLQ